MQITGKKARAREPTKPSIKLYNASMIVSTIFCNDRAAGVSVSLRVLKNARITSITVETQLLKSVLVIANPPIFAMGSGFNAMEICVILKGVQKLAIRNSTTIAEMINPLRLNTCHHLSWVGSEALNGPSTPHIRVLQSSFLPQR